MLETGQYRIILPPHLTTRLLHYGHNIIKSTPTDFRRVMPNRLDISWHLRTSFCRGERVTRVGLLRCYQYPHGWCTRALHFGATPPFKCCLDLHLALQHSARFIGFGRLKRWIIPSIMSRELIKPIMLDFPPYTRSATTPRCATLHCSPTIAPTTSSFRFAISCHCFCGYILTN